MILLSFDIEEFDVPRENGVEYSLEEGMNVSVEGANIIITSVCAKTMEGDKYYNIGKITVNSKTYTRSANLDNELKPIEIAKVTAKKLTTTYLSGAKLQIKVINKLTNQPIKSSKLTLKV